MSLISSPPLEKREKTGVLSTVTSTKIGFLCSGVDEVRCYSSGSSSIADGGCGDDGTRWFILLVVSHLLLLLLLLGYGVLVGWGRVREGCGVLRGFFPLAQVPTAATSTMPVKFQ
ncbi:hypothetical protein M0804_009887 [Polistes exclamans]|nr:hypothetical protein M0804_009887 [Polistes exclamans]